MLINVVGAGMAGSILTRLLRKSGHHVVLVDDMDRERCAGSQASSNLYIDSWLKKFPSEMVQKGIRVLEGLIPPGHINQPFSRGIGEALKVKHVAQEHLLLKPDVNATLVSVDPRGRCTIKAPMVTSASLPAPTVLCLGGQEPRVLADSQVEVLVGHCALFRGQLSPGQSSITMPLPYRHHKLYQFDSDTIYFADSTKVKLKTYEKEKDARQRALLESARKAGVTGELIEVRVGHRPIIPGKPFGAVRKISDGLWSMNGGGKNGLVAYAALAQELVDEFNRRPA